MAEFQKVIADGKRMCNSFVEYCTGCPLQTQNCSILKSDTDAKLLEIAVEQWAAEHPVKTNRMVLKEVFPNVVEKHVCARTMTGQSRKECSGFCIEDCDECSKKWLNEEYKGGAE